MRKGFTFSGLTHLRVYHYTAARQLDLPDCQGRTLVLLHVLLAVSIGLCIPLTCLALQSCLGRPYYHEIDGCGIQGRQVEKQAAGGVASWPIAER